MDREVSNSAERMDRRETDDARRVRGFVIGGRIRIHKEDRADYLLARNNKSVRRQNRSVRTERKYLQELKHKRNARDRCNQVKCADEKKAR